LNRLLHAALAIPIVLCQAPQAQAEVIDGIKLERLGSIDRIRLHFSGPVRYLRQARSADGLVANVYLQALEPETFGPPTTIDEVKFSPMYTGVPSFRVRVRLDPQCSPSPNPVCLMIQFQRASRYTIRPGDDRRALLLDFVSGAGGRSSNAVKDR